MDSRLLEDFNPDDLGMETLRQYRQQFFYVNPDHPWEQLNNKEFLGK